MSAFVHMELNTSNPKTAKKFYKSVFGWKMEDMKMPGGTYTMLHGPAGPIGGIQKSPMPNVPSHWLGYAGVGSVDSTIEKVKKSGGRVLVPRQEIAGMGALAVFSDPTGAAFAVWESAQPAPKPRKRAAKKRTAKKRAAKKSSTKRSTKKASKKGTKKAAKKSGNKRATKKSRKRR